TIRPGLQVRESDPPRPPQAVVGLQVPEAAGKLAELVRVTAEPMRVVSVEQEALRSQLLGAFAEQDPSEEELHLAEVLGTLAVHTAETARLRADADELVVKARELGASWRDVSRAAGITPQAALRRWDPEARKRHSDYAREHKRRDQ